MGSTMKRNLEELDVIEEVWEFWEILIFEDLEESCEVFEYFGG